MWIRSQDKMMLSEGRQLTVSPNMSSGCTNMFVRLDSIVIGIYKTEARCIKILDDIQEKIFDCSKNYVYEMPSE